MAEQQLKTEDLLECLGEFLQHRCVQPFDSHDVTSWLHNVDQKLFNQRWQDISWIEPSNIVFLYLLVRAELDAESDILDISPMHTIISSCIYMTMSYNGTEICNPMNIFLPSISNVKCAEVRKMFLKRCLNIIEKSSQNMLRINRNTMYFEHVYTELELYSNCRLIRYSVIKAAANIKATRAKATVPTNKSVVANATLIMQSGTDQSTNEPGAQGTSLTMTSQMMSRIET